MRDLVEARLWADHGHQLSGDLHRLFVGVRDGLAKLHQLEWEAPWRTAQLPASNGEKASTPRLKLAALALSAVLATVGATIAASGALSPGAVVLV